MKFMTKIMAVALLMTAFSHPVRAAIAADVTTIDVRFSVVNKNDSHAACEADGGNYEVRGWLALPRRTQAEGVTIYLHGAGDARTWHLTTVPRHDHISEMARMGHASLFIDQLGYGDSTVPDGTAICLGSLADIAAQIASHLRTGSYAASAARAPRFRRVGLAGHSMGGHITEVAAFSFPDAFDAAIIAGWGIVVRSEIVPVLVGVAKLASNCTLAPADKNGAPGYAYGLDPDEIGDALFYNAEARVVAAAARGWEPDPCGVHRSQGPAVFTSVTEAARATVPILVVYGDHDLFGAPDVYASRFTGSTDVSWLVVADSGHMMMLERPAPAFRAALHDWLRARGL